MSFRGGRRLCRSLGMLDIIVVLSAGRILRWGELVRKLSGLRRGRSKAGIFNLSSVKLIFVT